MLAKFSLQQRSKVHNNKISVCLCMGHVVMVLLNILQHCVVFLVLRDHGLYGVTIRT